MKNNKITQQKNVCVLEQAMWNFFTDKDSKDAQEYYETNLAVGQQNYNAIINQVNQTLYNIAKDTTMGPKEKADALDEYSRVLLNVTNKSKDDYASNKTFANAYKKQRSKNIVGRGATVVAGIGAVALAYLLYKKIKKAKQAYKEMAKQANEDAKSIDIAQFEKEFEEFEKNQNKK